MTLRFSKEMYPKIALLKAAYHFTPDAYIHLDSDNTHYIVSLSEKSATVPLPEQIGVYFTNELLAQSVRLAVSKQTEKLRELIMARAFASTIIEPPAEEMASSVGDDPDMDRILTDWFDENASSEI